MKRLLLKQEKATEEHFVKHGEYDEQVNGFSDETQENLYSSYKAIVYIPEAKDET